MKTRKVLQALKFAVVAINQDHSNLTGAHVLETIECECDHGETVRRLVRLAPKKKRKSVLNGKLTLAPSDKKQKKANAVVVS